MSQRSTESEAIYETIKREIVLFKIQPNVKLSETQLAERFGASRMPVRRALSQLLNEGLVDIRPQSGTFVTPVSFDKAANIQAIRRLLEPYAARIAAPLISDQDIRYLELQFKRLDEPMDKDAVCLTIHEVDACMHDLVLDYCGNQELADVIRRFRPITQRLNQYNLTNDPERCQKVIKEMKEVLEALKSKDGDRAFEEMQNHLSRVKTKKYHP